MKLRLKGNTIRFRLTQSEVAQLRTGQSLRESTEFSPSQRLNWVLEPVRSISAIEATFLDGTVAVRVPESELQTWAATDIEGIYGLAGAVEVSIEKDFRCLNRADSSGEPDAFPNPHDAAKW